MKTTRRYGRHLQTYYKRLLKAYGPQHWWPADTDIEVCVGAILTQNTSWKNVEKAMAQLEKDGFMTPSAMKNVSTQRLARAVRSSGYFNIKAARLKAFVKFLFEKYQGRLDLMFHEPLGRLRPALLSVKGIGPETADSILLYAGRKPVFVVDLYTRRVLYRHRMFPWTASYDHLQRFFMDRLKPGIPLYKEYHALLVQVGKRHCRSTPRCEDCPLEPCLSRPLPSP